MYDEERSNSIDRDKRMAALEKDTEELLALKRAAGVAETAWGIYDGDYGEAEERKLLLLYVSRARKQPRASQPRRLQLSHSSRASG